MAHDEPTATDLVIFQLPPPAFPFHSFPVLSFVYPSGTNEVPCTAEVVQPVCLPFSWGKLKIHRIRIMMSMTNHGRTSKICPKIFRAVNSERVRV